MIAVTLPWPDKHLSPNARVHHRVKAEYIKMAREVAFYTTRETNYISLYTPEDELLLTVTAYPPDCRRRDLDNVLAMCKAYQDGICQALNIDDQQIRAVTVSWGDKRRGGKIEMQLAYPYR